MAGQYISHRGPASAIRVLLHPGNAAWASRASITDGQRMSVESGHSRKPRLYPAVTPKPVGRRLLRCCGRARHGRKSKSADTLGHGSLSRAPGAESWPSSCAAAVTCIHRQHGLAASGLATSHWKLSSNRQIPAPAARQ
ncbi:hypothetical protein TgHK011_006290 [Trichoderma gracile]|nr:hypothetical protein TgHK011_006290 [Trichoderma gracile]